MATKDSDHAGCGNWACVIERPKGQGTNGACNCLRALPKSKQMALKRKLHSEQFYRQRVQEIERNKHEFPEPYYTLICNILANGKIRP